MITDNSEKQRHIDWLADQDTQRLLVASGYFEPRIWRNPRTGDGIADSLRDLKEFKLLLGSKPSSDVGQAGMEYLDLGAQVNLEAKAIAEKFLSDQGISPNDIDTLRVLNRLEFNREHQKLVKQLVHWLKGETGTDVQIRYWASDFLHAKLILALDDDGKGTASVGSSNFTPAGLGFSKKVGDQITGNRELNLITVDEETVKELSGWFEAHWNAMSDPGDLDFEPHPFTIDWKPRLIQLLHESKFGDKRHDPRLVFLKVLYEYFEARYGPEGALREIGVELTDLQKRSFRQSIHHLERFNGVLIADAVGLGKTFTGLALLDHYLSQRKPGRKPRALIICPAQLRGMWESKTRLLNINVHDFVTMEQLGRMSYADEESEEEPEFHELLAEYGDHDIILVDEAHNFRNMWTKRFQNLMKLMQGGNPDKKLILMTATPINLDLNDLKHQILLLARGHPQYYRSIGVTNIESFFRRVIDTDAETPADIYQMLENVLVRHSRIDVLRDKERGITHYIPIDGGNVPVTFPERKLFRIDYDLAAVYGGEAVFNDLKEWLVSLKHAPYDIEEYLDLDEDEKKKRRGSMGHLMTVMLLKRLESSSYAFELSIQMFRDYLSIFKEVVLTHRKVLSSKAFRRFQSVIAAQGHDTEEASEILALEAAQKIIDEQFGVDYNELDDLEWDIFEQEKFKLAVDYDIEIYDKVLNLLKKSKDEWIEQVKKGEHPELGVGRTTSLGEALEGGLVTDLKIESFKQAYLNGLVAQDERPVQVFVTDPNTHGREERMIRYPARPEMPPIKDNADGKIVIFCYFRDTAKFLYDAVINDAGFLEAAGLKTEEVALVHGGTSKGPHSPFSDSANRRGQTRSEVLWRFSPVSNIDANNPNQIKKKGLWNEHPVKLLITTDVLSEGQNLQDSQGLANFDLHWNPVRMIQRVGRVDRLFSKHDHLHIVNVFPDVHLEGIMDLVGRIMRRSQVIDSIIGLDGSTLGEEIEGVTYHDRTRIWECDEEVLDDLERVQDFASIDEMRFPLLDFLAEERETARGTLAGMQMGVHSRVLGYHRVAKAEKDKGVFLSFKVGRESDGSLLHEWLWWPASTIPAMSEEDKVTRSLELLALMNVGLSKEQESELDQLWKPDGSPLSSKPRIYPEIYVENCDAEIWEGEWVDDRLKHWIWPLAEASIRHIIREGMAIGQKDRLAKKTKTGLNQKLAPVIRQYTAGFSPKRRADPVRLKRVMQLVDENRIPGSEPYRKLLKELAEEETLHESNPLDNPEPDFAAFIHRVDQQLARDRIWTAADLIRTVDAINRNDIQLVAFLVIN